MKLPNSKSSAGPTGTGPSTSAQLSQTPQPASGERSRLDASPSPAPARVVGSPQLPNVTATGTVRPPPNADGSDPLADPLAFDLPLTREAMADYLGLTLETVSRQISALRKDGVIELEGKRHVIVPDMARLMEEAGDDADGGMLV